LVSLCVCGARSDEASGGPWVVPCSNPVELMLAGFASLQPWQRSHIAIMDSTLIYSDLSYVDIGFEYLYCKVAKL